MNRNHHQEAATLIFCASASLVPMISYAVVKIRSTVHTNRIKKEQ